MYDVKLFKAFLRVKTKGDNFKKFLPPNYSSSRLRVCWDYEKEKCRVKTLVYIIKRKLRGALKIEIYFFVVKKNISLTQVKHLTGLPHNLLVSKLRLSSLDTSAVARLDLLAGGGGQSGAPKARAARGSGGMLPWKILNYRVSQIAFSAF